MERIKLSNFRKIKDSWDLNISPVSFFTGTNNSGKSTIFKSLLLLEDFVKSNNHFELDFYGENSRKHKIDCFSNAINKVNRSNFDLNISFEYSQKGYDIKLVFQPDEIKDKIISKGKLEYLEVLNINNKSNLIIERNGGVEYTLKLDLEFLNLASEKASEKVKTNELALILTTENIIKDDIIEYSTLKNKKEKLLIVLENKRKEAFADSYKKEVVLPNSVTRLHQVLRELNISLDRAVGFLGERGINIESRPTTKINKDIYKALYDEFYTDAIKKQHSKNEEEDTKDIRSVERRLLELKLEISKNRKKLNELKKIQKEKNKVNKDRVVIMPEFSLNDFNEDFLSIDNIIRAVLPNYFIGEQKKLGKSDESTEVKRAYEFADNILEIISFSVDHLSPHRNSQTRLYINNNASSDMNEIIREHSFKPIVKSSVAGKFIKRWMKEFDIGEDFKIKQIEGLATQIELTYNGEITNLADKGFGAGQVFAILLKIALLINKLIKKKDSSIILLIEEPEANLHPALQQKLSNLFYEVQANFGINFILETHSEYMIRMSQIIVKQIHEKEETAKIPFIAYYFDKEDKPYSMIYRKDGKFTNEFGSGFFDVSSNLAFDIL